MKNSYIYLVLLVLLLGFISYILYNLYKLHNFGYNNEYFGIPWVGYIPYKYRDRVFYDSNSDVKHLYRYTSDESHKSRNLSPFYLNTWKSKVKTATNNSTNMDNNHNFQIDNSQKQIGGHNNFLPDTPPKIGMCDLNMCKCEEDEMTCKPVINNVGWPMKKIIYDKNKSFNEKYVESHGNQFTVPKYPNKPPDKYTELHRGYFRN